MMCVVCCVCVCGQRWRLFKWDLRSSVSLCASLTEGMCVCLLCAVYVCVHVLCNVCGVCVYECVCYYCVLTCVLCMSLLCVFVVVVVVVVAEQYGRSQTSSIQHE